jgi:hypothetical protein
MKTWKKKPNGIRWSMPGVPGLHTPDSLGVLNGLLLVETDTSRDQSNNRTNANDNIAKCAPEPTKGIK